MNGCRYLIKMRIVKMLNVILLTAPFTVCWLFYYSKQIAFSMESYKKWEMVVLFMACYVIFARIYDAFLVSHHRISEMVYSQSLAVAIADTLIFMAICIFSQGITNVCPMVLALQAQMFLSAVWSLLVHKWYFRTYGALSSAVIYDGKKGFEELIREYGLSKKFRVSRSIYVKDCLEDLEALEGLQTVFLSDLHSHDRNVILKYCVDHHIMVYVIPRIGDIIMSGASQMHMFHLPMLRVGRYRPNPEYVFFKRVFDVVVSVLTLILMSPTILVTMIAIKLYDGGPIFYKQQRYTKDGKVFDIIKFRSMRVDAEALLGACLSTGENDPRITPVGRVIRRYRIDELPQLVNVLAGDMSIVGPRPERPEIAKDYERELPEFPLRLQMKAGITGFAQVYGKYNTTPYNKLKMDLMYIANPSMLEDLRICVATLKILFLADSTEGVSAGQRTALVKKEAEN